MVSETDLRLMFHWNAMFNAFSIAKASSLAPLLRLPVDPKPLLAASRQFVADNEAADDDDDQGAAWLRRLDSALADVATRSDDPDAGQRLHEWVTTGFGRPQSARHVLHQSSIFGRIRRSPQPPTGLDPEQWRTLQDRTEAAAIRLAEANRHVVEADQPSTEAEQAQYDSLVELGVTPLESLRHVILDNLVEEWWLEVTGLVGDQAPLLESLLDQPRRT